MKKYRVPLPISKINFSQDGVVFTTAHSSKGLEFKHVFLMGLESKKWEKAKKLSTNFSLPDTLTMSNEGNEEEELRRLFFVAVTRAKTNLEMSFSEKGLDEKEKIPSKFLAEITQQNPDLKTEKIALDEEVIEDYYSLLFQSINSNFGIIESEEINKILENFSLSVSSLNTYLRCPVQFYFEKILRVPSSENSAMAFGNAVHYGLEHYLKTAKVKGKFGNFGALKTFFEKGMFLKKNIFTEDEYKKLLTHGNKVLKDFYEFRKSEFSLKSSAEKSINTVLKTPHPNPLPEGEGETAIKINGKIDRIDTLENGEVKIVDYKTGKFRKPKFLPASEDFEIGNYEKNEFKKLGGDYWRQAVFYKILFDQDVYTKFNVNNIGFEFVEDKENPELIVNIGNNDVEKVKKQISEVWHKIKTHQFHVGCEDEKCFWCNFKNNLEN